ncbi:hypothetical protein L7F22_049581 [Adiantum nelumboides]|nr:hypothetical protein [Adiantum nelumboides]
MAVYEVLLLSQLLLIIPLFPITLLPAPALSLQFNYPTMGRDAIQDHVTGMGNVSFTSEYVDLTGKNNDPFESTGRIYNRKQLLLWDSATQQAASFNCSFSFSIVPAIKNIPPADGMAFFLLDPKLSDVPDKNKGSGLGLPLNALGFVAVEFDTYLNDKIDYSDNHIGIDVNFDVVSEKYANLSFGLTNSSFVYSWVDYYSSKSMLEVYATNLSNTKPTSPVLTHYINLTKILPQSVLIGFSAATGGKAEFHQIHSWSFSSTSIAKLEKASPKVSLIAGLVVSATVVSIVFLLFLLQKRRSRQRCKDLLPSRMPHGGLPTPDHEEADLGPQKFSYRNLSIATNSFGDNCLLGKGGSGSVYRGLLPNTGREVAVKCISQKSTQGEREFLAELSIISRIRHKNLVQLKGWCRDKSHSQLLLVYEYLPNGSLYRSLFSKTSSLILNWNHRFHIICGLGSAIQYLHQECERVIVHRDIKASNVLLDTNYKAKLGDFGLARQLGEEVEGHTTLAAGTLGYMAPELFRTGRATTMSDVYSYGMVLLEVVCGRRLGDASLPGEFAGCLLDWVWDLHSKGRLREACDGRLEGDVDEEQVVRTLTVGLACLHPDLKLRPSIQAALDALEGRGSLLVPPTYKPIVSYGSGSLSSISLSGSTSTGTISS